MEWKDSHFDCKTDNNKGDSYTKGCSAYELWDPKAQVGHVECSGQRIQISDAEKVERRCDRP